MGLDEISKAAEKEREKNNRPKKEYAPKEKIFRPVSPESWKIYSLIYPYSISFKFIFFSFIITTTFLTIYFTGGYAWSLYLTLVFGGIIFIRVLLYYILKIARFSNFKKWRTSLNFPINGWDYLGTNPDYPKTYEWDRDITLKINFKESALNEERKLMHDALYLFTSNANKCFYALEDVQAGYMGDIRKQWVINDKLTASGSGDDSVLGEIYLSIDKHFRKIHEKYQCINSIDIIFSKKTFKAEPPSTSGD
jgi:hypothetical protein